MCVCGCVTLAPVGNKDVQVETVLTSSGARLQQVHLEATISSLGCLQDSWNGEMGGGQEVLIFCSRRSAGLSPLSSKSGRVLQPGPMFRLLLLKVRVITAPSWVWLWFLPPPGDIGKGNAFEDLHSPDEAHPVAPALHQPRLCLHHTQLRARTRTRAHTHTHTQSIM